MKDIADAIRISIDDTERLMKMGPDDPGRGDVLRNLHLHLIKANTGLVIREQVEKRIANSDHVTDHGFARAIWENKSDDMTP